MLLSNFVIYSFTCIYTESFCTDNPVSLAVVMRFVLLVNNALMYVIFYMHQC